jgi:glycosyltransferase involved in cell wall biosynthesis
MKLGVGICARNEEAGIIATITSVVQSLCSVAYPLDWELIICINGSTDSTAELVKQWMMNTQVQNTSLEQIETPNLVEAQRLIANRLQDTGANMLAFFDADILVEVECVSELLSIAAEDSIRAVYARSVPINNVNATLVEKCLNLYDSNNNVFSKRRHLHGRAFIIKEWWIPATNPQLLADDIYLSCDLLYRFGQDAIAMSPKAKVYFHQISTAADFYRAQKRRNQELNKCLQLFPHFSSLPTEQLNRRVVWSNLLAEPLPQIFLWILLLGLKSFCRLRFYFDSSSSGGSGGVWDITTTSKKAF